MPPLRSTRPIALSLLALVLVLLFAFPDSAEAVDWKFWKGPFERGQKVEFTGIVTDADARPLQGVQVILEAERREFRARRMRKEPVDTFRVSATTGQRGEYTILWPWNSYYDRYYLLVAVPYRKAGRDTLSVLQRYDITEKVKDVTPIVTPLEVKDVTFLNSLRSFLANVDTADEKRIYQEAGKPDKVENVGTGGAFGSTWWYFDTGKLYRFEGGELLETKDFEPVEKF